MKSEDRFVNNDAVTEQQRARAAGADNQPHKGAKATIQANRKYLLLIPLVVSLIMLLFFSAAYEEIVHEKREQKYHSMKASLDMIASQIDRFVSEDNDWGQYDYLGLLKPMVEQLDNEPMLYAELFDHDLVSHSTHFVDDGLEPFRLAGNEAFHHAVNEDGDRGELTLTYDDGVHAPYDLYVYFRKLPSGDFQNRAVIAIGVSKYAIAQNFALWLQWGVVGLVSMTVLLQIWMILYISKLSDTERELKKRLAHMSR